MLDLRVKDTTGYRYMPDLPQWDREDLRYLPGDLIGLIYPEMIRTEVIRRCLSEEQQLEFKQYLICEICGRPCAGTCEIRKRKL
jgi:hypothetical protein